MFLKYLYNVIFAFSIASLASVAHAKQLSNYMQKQLNSAKKLMEEESWVESKKLLSALLDETNSRFAKALVHHSLGQIAVYEEDYKSALTHFKDAYDLKTLDEDAQSQLLHGIGQLHCGVEEWQECREKMLTWIKQYPKNVGASDYLIVAQAFSATEDWSDVLAPIRKAIELKRAVPISWYRIEVGALSNLEYWPEALQAQFRLISRYAEEPAEWRRLVSIHLQLEDFKGALSSMRIPFESGLLDTKRDYKQMSQLLYHEGVPFSAAEVMSKGLELGRLDQDESNLKLLGSLWLQAKEYDAAIAVYEKLVELDPKVIWVKQLTRLYFQQSEWLLASRLLKKTLKTSFESEFKLMLSIALINLDELAEARRILLTLQKDEGIKDRVSNWLSYIDSVSA